MTLAIVAIALICGGLGVVIWFALGGASAIRKQMLANLTRNSVEPKATNQPTRGTSSYGARMQRAAPESVRHGIEKMWARAGRPEDNTPEQVFGAMLLYGVVGLILGLVMFRLLNAPVNFLVGIGIPVLLFILPVVRLDSKGKDRQTQIRRSLPDMLDQMSIAVNAGLGFDAAMLRVSKGGKGPLAQEMLRTLQDIQVGQARRAAYADLGARTEVDTLNRFTRAIVQAEAYGIALSTVLQTQADELRMERRQTAERKAMEIPVKVVFPLLLFIMPAMFIVLIGPGIIRIAHSFGLMGG